MYKVNENSKTDYPWINRAIFVKCFTDLNIDVESIPNWKRGLMCCTVKGDDPSKIKYYKFLQAIGE